jgi:hypothetical protein
LRHRQDCANRSGLGMRPIGEVSRYESLAYRATWEKKSRMRGFSEPTTSIDKRIEFRDSRQNITRSGKAHNRLETILDSDRPKGILSSSKKMGRPI